MADDAQSGDRGEAADRPQDPLVERLRPDPAQPPEPTRILEGLLGDSDRPGRRRLYFTAELDHYAEFRSDDVLSLADIPPDQPPFLGEPATRVTLRRDATIDVTHTQRPRPLDEFDLDVRLAARPALAARPSTFGFCTVDTCQAECPGDTRDCPLPTRGCETFQITICRGRTCIEVCDTDEDHTCQTCLNTCHTACATCQTCQTDCGQATCNTCATRCGQATCNTCATQCGTCATHCGTCGQRTCVPSFPTCGGRCPEP